MTEELFGILNDADEVMESIGYDPLGMNTVLEGLPSMYSMINGRLDKIDGYDLSKEEDIKKLQTKIKKTNDIKVILKIWTGLSLVVSSGAFLSAAIHDPNTTSGKVGISLSIIFGLLSLVSGQVSALISNAIRKSNEGELMYISKTLESTIKKLDDASNKATGAGKDKIEKQIRDAESFKNKVDTQLGIIRNDRQEDAIQAMNNIGNAGYVNAGVRIID